MKRNIFRFLLSAVLMMCCTVGTNAQLGTPPNNEIWYLTKDGGMLDDSKYKVGKTFCGRTIIEHNPYKWFNKYIIKLSDDVTEINDEAFYDEDDLTAVSFPNTVEWIGRETDGTGVFEDCDNLESVTVPASVKYIGRCAFYDCIALKSFSCDNVEIIYPEAFYNCESLKSVNLGTKLKEIRWSSQGNEYGAFEDCDALETVAIPASVTHIGKRAFYWCNKLKFVAIGSGVKEIAEKAFYNCNELKCVAIDGNVTTIGEDAFNDCEKLESVAFLGDTPPSSFGEDCFYDCSPSLKCYVLEENYNTYNANSTLRGKVVAGPPYNEIWYTTNDGGTAGQILLDVNRPALNVHMGNHCVQIYNDPPKLSYGEICFHDCTNLVSVVLPSSITDIGSQAFERCSSLVSVSIPNTVTSIGDFAFYQCYSLVSISIPNKVTSIGEFAFHDCTSLQNIILPDGLNYISKHTFYYCSALKSVTIGNSVAGIGDYAFYRCSALTSVTIGNSVESIGDHAFAHCSALASVTMGNSVESIANYAFSDCSALQTVTFKTIPLLYEDAFFLCNKLSSKILDLTDSDKPYIGTSLGNYPGGGFTEARYRRTLEEGKWGTIVLPFAPTDGLEGLEFYELEKMVTTDGGSLVFTKVNAPKAGVPYLVKNVSDSETNFTLTANTPNVTVETQGQTVDAFTLKGSFQQVSLNTTEVPNGNLYCLKDGKFCHETGQINIAPFRAYIEGNGATQAEISIITDVTAIPGIMDKNGNIDETEAIYDLSGRKLSAPVKGQVNIIRLKSGKTVKRIF